MPLNLGTRLRPFAVAGMVLALLAAPTAAQVGPQSPTPAPEDTGAGTTGSLQRIRRALSVPPPAGFLDLSEYVHVFAEAPEEVSLFEDFDLFSGPVPFGPPTHYDMHGLTPPMGALYSFGVDTVAIALLSRAGKAIMGLFTGDEDSVPAVPSLLGHAEREQALAEIQGHPSVLEATMEQRGRTVALALVVPATTPVATARQLGDDFLRMVTTLAGAAPDPGGDSRAGDYDYIIGVRTPTDTDIAVGGKPTDSARITW